MLYYSHLNGTVLHSGGVVLDALTRPSLMITGALNASVSHPSRKERYAAMFGKLYLGLHRSLVVANDYDI